MFAAWERSGSMIQTFKRPRCRGFEPQEGILIFFSYVGSSLASALQPKKYQEFHAPPKILKILGAPQKYPPFCTLTVRKYLKMHRNDP